VGKILTATETTGRFLIKEGTYMAEFSGYRELPNAKFGDAIILDFKITDDASNAYGIVLGMICSEKLSPNAKLFNVVTALQGDTPKPGEEIDLDTLKEKMCKVVIKTKGDGANKFSVVAEVLPFSKEG